MGNSADKPQQNVIVAQDVNQWPDSGDPRVLYHQTYEGAEGDPQRGLYFWNPETNALEQLVYGSEETYHKALRIVATNGVMINWRWNDNQDTTIDPGTGQMKSNNTNLSGVTEFAINNIDLFNRQVAGFEDAIPLVEVGDPWIVQDLEKISWYWYTVSALPIQETDFFRVPVTAQAGKTANPGVGQVMEVQWLPRLDLTRNYSLPGPL